MSSHSTLPLHIQPLTKCNTIDHSKNHSGTSNICAVIHGQVTPRIYACSLQRNGNITEKCNSSKALMLCGDSWMSMNALGLDPSDRCEVQHPESQTDWIIGMWAEFLSAWWYKTAKYSCYLAIYEIRSLHFSCVLHFIDLKLFHLCSLLVPDDRKKRCPS